LGVQKQRGFTQGFDVVFAKGLCFIFIIDLEFVKIHEFYETLKNSLKFPKICGVGLAFKGNITFGH